MSRIVIKAEKLSKAYQIGEIGTGTLSRDLERWWAKLRGMEDPFLRLGETHNQNIKNTGDLVWSLKDLSFDIAQGDALGIIGPNGAGKSTLLKILSRITAPTYGKVKVRGRIASLLEVGTGFHPELTGKENIYLNGAIMGMRKAEISRRFDEIVNFAGIERYIDTPVKRYSSGMYVRLAFAVAAHLESEIMIVDEVLAVGDTAFQKKCLGKMDEVSKAEGKTVLFVSHNMASISSLCNKGIVLQKGALTYAGTTAQAISLYSKSTLNQAKRTVLSNHCLSELVTLDHFEIDKAEVISQEDLAFQLSVKSAIPNPIQSIALFIYDVFDQKVAFIDLRSEQLSKLRNGTNMLQLDGHLKKIPLLPGRYSLGLHIQSTLLYKDFSNLLQFEVMQKQLVDELLPYPLSVRGHIEIDYSFQTR